MVRARSPRFFFPFSFLFSSHSFPVSLAPRLRRDAFSFLFHFSFHFLFLFFIFFVFHFAFIFLFATPPFFFPFFLIFFVLLFLFVFLFSFTFSFFLSLFFSSFYFFLPIQPIQYFPAFFFLSLFFLLLLFYLSCLQSILCSPFLPVLFSFFYPSHSNLFPVHRQPLAGHSSFFLFSLLFHPPSILPRPVQPAFRQPFLFFFLLFFLSSTITHTLSSSPPAAVKRRKKIGKRILRGEIASRKKTGSGRKGRGTGWSPGVEGWRT